MSLRLRRSRGIKSGRSFLRRRGLLGWGVGKGSGRTRNVEGGMGDGEEMVIGVMMWSLIVKTKMSVRNYLAGFGVRKEREGGEQGGLGVKGCIRFREFGFREFGVWSLAIPTTRHDTIYPQHIPYTNLPGQALDRRNVS